MLKLLEKYYKKVVSKKNSNLSGKSISSEKDFQIMDYRPDIFLVETVFGCNLKCPECAVGGDLTNRTKGVMSFEQYKIIADRIKPFAKTVYLIIWGEPLLNKDIVKIINYTSKFARTSISTNGILMTPEKAKELILSGLSEIIISIDGTTQEVYEQYRIGGSLEKAIECLKMISEANKKYKKGVHIIPQFIVFQHNQHQIEDFTRLCESIGVAPVFKSPYMRKNSRYSNSSIPEYIRPHYNDENLRKNAMRGCQDPKQVMTVLIDGSCVPCCHANDATVNFGNMFEKDCLDIWNGHEYLEFRKNHINGNIHNFCLDNCLLYFLKEQKNV